MPKLTVFIEDQIRGERVRVMLNVDWPIAALIEGLVDEFGLPRRDFDLSRIEYRLVRAIDETYFSGRTTLRQAGISDGELLQLISPDGRRVWRSVQKILDEIESETIDKFKGELKDKVIKEVWDRVTKKLAEIEKTQTGGDRVQRLREWVDKVGGPTRLVEITDEAVKVAGPARTTRLLRWGVTVVAVGGTLLVSRFIFPVTRPVEVTRIVEEPIEVTRIVEQPVEVTRIVEQKVEVTRVVESPIEVTRIIEQPVEVTREVTREVKVPRAVIVEVPLNCILCDDFNPPSDDVFFTPWPTGSYSNRLVTTGSRTITNNGKYLVKATTNSGVTWPTIPQYNLTASITDFYLTVDAQRVSAPLDAEYGVVFRRVDGDNYYMFIISDSRTFEFWAQENDQWRSIKSLQNIGAIQPGRPNQLMVSAKGSNFIFLVNGQYVWEESDSRLRAGTAGLVVALDPGDEAAFEFDNFELRVP